MTAFDSVLETLRQEITQLNLAVSVISRYRPAIEAEATPAVQPRRIAARKPKLLADPKRASGEGAKTCSECGEEFTPRNGRKGSKCAECLAKYAREWYRKKHEKAAEPVTSGQPQLCPLCHDPCSTPARLKRHMALVHGKQQPQT